MANDIDDEDRTLMQQSATGDLVAFETLVKRWQLPLRAYFMKHGSVENAEDLTQQTLIKLYRNRARYICSARFTTYLFHIAHNVQIDAWRSAGRRQTMMEGFIEHTVEDVALPRTPDVLDIPAALAHLPPKQRIVVERICLNAHSYQDVAQELSIPEGTVKSRLSIALQRMRNYFAERDYHGTTS